MRNRIAVVKTFDVLPYVQSERATELIQTLHETPYALTHSRDAHRLFAAGEQLISPFQHDAFHLRFGGKKDLVNGVP